DLHIIHHREAGRSWTRGLDPGPGSCLHYSSILLLVLLVGLVRSASSNPIPLLGPLSAAVVLRLFVVEDHILHTTQGLVNAAYVAELWDLALSKTIAALRTHSSYCDDPDLVLDLKNLIVLFADTLQGYGFPVSQLFDLLLEMRDQYREILLKKWTHTFRVCSEGSDGLGQRQVPQLCDWYDKSSSHDKHHQMSLDYRRLDAELRTTEPQNLRTTAAESGPRRGIGLLEADRTRPTSSTSSKMEE
ncbi:hypothetical protein CRUP_020827, partial [Coryphaenoides rupestris]